MITPTKQSSIFGNLDVAENVTTLAKETLKSLSQDPSFRLRKQDILRAKGYSKRIKELLKDIDPILKDFNAVAK